MDYLIDSILDASQHDFSEVYNFVRDRARAIVQDLTVQDLRDELCIQLHEQIARFFIMARSGPPCDAARRALMRPGAQAPAVRAGRALRQRLQVGRRAQV